MESTHEVTRSLLGLVCCAGLALAGCARPAAPTPSPQATLLAAPTSATPTAAPSATPTATATPVPPPLSLEAPQWLGRGAIVDACFTADARLLAIGWGNGVSLWSSEAGAELWWRPTDARVMAVDVEPQGRAVAALLEDGRVAVFEAVSAEARRFKGTVPNLWEGDIAWSPDGERIAVQGTDTSARGRSIYLLDPKSGAVQEVPGTKIDPPAPPALVWSADGQGVTLTRLGIYSTLVDAQTGEARLTLKSGDACYSPWALAWSPDGRTIAGVQGDRLDLLDAQSGQRLRSLEDGLLDQPASGPCCRLAFSADGRRLVNWGFGTISTVHWALLTVWDVASGQVLGQLQSRLEDKGRLVAGLYGDSVISLFSNGEVARWRIAADEAEETVIDRLPVLVPEPWLAWSADGSRLAAAGRGGLAVWDTATRTPLATFGPEFSVPALSADGRLLAMTDTERHEEVIYDLAAGAVVRTLPEAAPILQGAAFSPDGHLIAYGAGNRALLAEVATGQVRAELAGYPQTQAIDRVVWGPDSSVLVVASGKERADNEPGVIILWERNNDGSFFESFRLQSLQTGACDRPLALFNPSSALVALEEAPDLPGQTNVVVFDRQSGRPLRRVKDWSLGAWASEEALVVEAWPPRSIVCWNVRSGERTAGRKTDSHRLTFAPGAAYYTWRPEQARPVEVLDVATGHTLCSAYHALEVIHVSWSPDGRRLASLEQNGTIVVWTVGEGPCRWPWETEPG